MRETIDRRPGWSTGCDVMALAIRLMATMTGLVLLTATALGLLAYRNIGTPTLLAGLAAVAGILVLAVPLAWTVARNSADAAAAELRDQAATLLDERSKRRAVEFA